ncbi:MAG: hypothetical protein K2J47_08795 [Ruminococcus sp.]|nr:hypothetical protein [Ruminococcus sp.]
MPELKKTKEAEFLDCASKNIKILCKSLGADKIAIIMGLSPNSVYNRIKKPALITLQDVLRLSDYTCKEVNDFIHPIFQEKGK